MTLIGGGVLIAVALIVGAAPGQHRDRRARPPAAVVLLVLLIVWLLASSRASQDFFIAYAGGRGLTRIDGRSNLPPVTPLLQKGDNRYAEQRFNGVLPGGMDGSLCLYTYEETTHDSTATARPPTSTTRSR